MKFLKEGLVMNKSGYMVRGCGGVGVWRCEGMGVWKYGGMGVWGYGDMGVRRGIHSETCSLSSPHTPTPPHPHTPIPPYLILILLLVSACAPSERTWHEEPGYRWTELDVRRGDAGFEMLPAAKTGVTFVNRLTNEQIVENRHRMHGSGVALGDVDGDGWTDVYLARLEGDNVLYRNLGGWKFEDITVQAGVGAPDRFSTGAVLADIDGDDDLDLLVTAMGGPNAVFLNKGGGNFEEATEALGLGSGRGSTTMALADVEGDGDLDLYVANYKSIALRDSLHPRKNAWEYVVQRVGGEYRINPELEDHYVLKELDTRLIKLEQAESDRFYMNDGGGNFTEISFEKKILDENGEPLPRVPRDWALTVRFQDLNDDGAPDLYVCNDFESPDHVWLNDGRGVFRPAAPHAIRKTSNATMSVAFSDIERDGRLDIFMADMLSRDYSMRQAQRGTQIPLPAAIGAIDNRPQVMRNVLLKNRGDGTYAEVAGLMEVEASDWTWASVFLDVDLDGYEDLLLSNGHAFDVQHLDAQDAERYKARRMSDPVEMRRLLLDFPPLPLKNAVFRNDHGLNFIDQPEGWGLGTEADVSHGMALGDLDNDGDLDVVINRLNALAGIYENTGSAPRVAVRLRGSGGNSQGIGAKIRLLGGPAAIQEKEVISGGQYLSGSDPVYSFAAGSVPDDLELEIAWRSGAVSRIEGVMPNRAYEIEEESASVNSTVESIQEAPPPFFEEVPLDHIHAEAAFDDFARQPLLPRRFSQMGPAVVWADVDRDGDDDLLVGSGRGGRLSLFRNDGGRLVSQTVGPAGEAAELDQAGIVVAPRSGAAHVFVASTNYEAERGTPSRIDVYTVEGRSWRLEQQLHGGLAGIGPLAVADIDGDGDLDLFAGAALSPGRYPEPVSSRIFTLHGSYAYDSSRSTPFENMGMVRGAVFGDVDGDGDQDLALALEWGGLKLFLNDGAGNFSDASDAWGLAEATGLWQGVEMADFDGDGRLDLAATNWGWNSIFGRPDHPLRLYWGDYDGNGSLDVLESHFEPALNGYVPEVGLNLLTYSIPSVRRHILTFEAFSKMTIDDVVGPGFERDSYAEVRHLAHRVYLNRGDRFEGNDLPLLSQVAPGFGIAVGDFDADGHEDAFIAQNFFAERLEVPRSDAGRGLWIRGTGNGDFELAEGTTTGVKVYGEQRGVGLSDYDGDGRLDLAVSQNGNALKVFRNAETSAGVRVRLEGPPGNSWGIGSRIRAVYEDGSMGPARNVAAGSGYLGQRSAVQVLGAVEGKRIARIHVFWPDGSEQEAAVDGGEALVNYSM